MTQDAPPLSSKLVHFRTVCLMLQEKCTLHSALNVLWEALVDSTGEETICAVSLKLSTSIIEQSQFVLPRSTMLQTSKTSFIGNAHWLALLPSFLPLVDEHVRWPILSFVSSTRYESVCLWFSAVCLPGWYTEYNSTTAEETCQPCRQGYYKEIISTEGYPYDSTHISVWVGVVESISRQLLLS